MTMCDIERRWDEAEKRRETYLTEETLPMSVISAKLKNGMEYREGVAAGAEAQAEKKIHWTRECAKAVFEALSDPEGRREERASSEGPSVCFPEDSTLSAAGSHQGSEPQRSWQNRLDRAHLTHDAMRLRGGDSFWITQSVAANKDPSTLNRIPFRL